MAFLEEEENITSSLRPSGTSLYEGGYVRSPSSRGMSAGQGEFSFVTSTNAVDYSDRLPVVYGRKLWILTNSSNTPIQEIVTGEIDLMSYTTPSIAHFRDNDTFTGTWKLLYAIMKHKALKKISPTDCPDGFIPVPGNPELDQEWFCVAKYEMSYTDATIPDSTGWGTDWNTKTYDVTKTVVSEAGKYPVVDITQSEAISSCASMGNGYHLITNKEWMTIARNIELQEENWSNGITWSWYIFSGNSNQITYWCSDNTWPRTWATTTGWTDTKNLHSSRTTCGEKRQLLLSNGEIVWDMSGNVWEHVNKADTLDGSWFDTGTNPDILVTNDSWAEWTASGASHRDIYWPLLSTWNALQAIWRLYQADGTVFVRGGHASSSWSSGIFSLILNWQSTTLYKDVGFRCAR